MPHITLSDHAEILALIAELRRAGKPVHLDLFCCQGGASAGYERAGFTVLGVDLDPQPRYPYAFVQADAVEFLLRYGHLFDSVSASPPCQAFTLAQRIQANEHPDFITPTRKLLTELGRPWVIENVPGAPLELPVVLCGAMFGLHTYRHRLFETGGGFTFRAPEHPEHTAKTVKMGRPLRDGDFYHAVGHFTGVAYVRRDLDMPWATRDGLRECIPPAYSAFIGAYLLHHLTSN
ncbi:SAM-dependent methyltransferase [Streptomyces sp. 135]|uniref:SAM-dependent methyltransferase n=1 Tax=Streptomyces sp. 135 TaxID=2838850 RepID=UPI001CBA9B7E|nr:SAM-dependent methyltransferase [Streptomyces sp. 135]